MGHKDPDRRREYQREYTRAGRQLMKKLQRCIQCGEQDAFTLAGRARCAECAEKARIYNRERAAKHQEEINARNRRYAEDRKAAGLCVKCGRPSDGHSLPHLQGEGRGTCQESPWRRFAGRWWAL